MKNLWLIGVGKMGQSYAKIFNDLKLEYLAIGRSQQGVEFFEQSTGKKAYVGGLDILLKNKEYDVVPTHAVVATDAIYLYETTLKLLKLGVKNILVEKPGPLKVEETKTLLEIAKDVNSKIIIGYNRRFYASVLKLKKILENKPLTSIDFEFTEWIHKLNMEDKSNLEKEKLLLVYSTHIIDLAFYLAGRPKEIVSYANNGFDWHTSGGVFAGAGVTNNNVIFSYKANWKSAGRWVLNVLTDEEKFILSPLEKLQFQKKGSIEQCFDESIDYTLDEKHKPGLYLQTKNFLENNFAGMCTIDEQYKMIDIYNKIANYK